MTEIYKNRSLTAKLTIRGAVADTTPTAVGNFGGDPVPLTVTGGDVVDGNQTWNASIGFSRTQEESSFSVEWTFLIDGEEGKKVEWFDVVTPLVTVARAREELEIPASVTDDQIVLTERKVRRIIERFCGQKFGLTRETHLVRGSGLRELRLPARLHSVVGVSYNGFPVYSTSLNIRNDGWSIRNVWSVGHEVITGSVPIVDPRLEKTYVFPNGTEYYIDGYWGYDRVPQAVQEAALILIEQELCPEAVYRERFIDNVASADFRYNVNSAAFSGTGNVTADALLSEYVAQGTAIL